MSVCVPAVAHSGAVTPLHSVCAAPSIVESSSIVTSRRTLASPGSETESGSAHASLDGSSPITALPNPRPVSGSRASRRACVIGPFAAAVPGASSVVASMTRVSPGANGPTGVPSMHEELAAAAAQATTARKAGVRKSFDDMGGPRA